MIKVESEIDFYEVDDKEVGIGKHPRPSMKVVSHWNHNNMAVLVVGGKRYTVVADDLIAAINNATNSRRF